MNENLPKGAKVYNVIRADMNSVYLPELPEATANNITSISNILFDENYQPMLNEFVNTLINRIALTIVRNKSFNNPLNVFKKGSIPLGTDIQEIYENPAEAEPYELSNTEMAKLLSITNPDTHVAYYRRNRRDLYTKTISRENLQGAFVSWEKFTQYIESITTSLYSGNYIDEFELTKSLIEGAYENNKVVVQKVTAVTDETSAKAFLKTIRALYNKMKFPSTEYNAYSKFSGAKGKITTWTEDSRVVVIATADLLAEIDVDVLATAFNIDKTNFIGRVIPIDSFKNPNIQAVICDESWLLIYDNLFRFDEFYNARVMAWNEYLHIWGTYAISPFANAIVLATETPVPATELSIVDDNIELDLTTTPTGEKLDITVSPTNATTNINYSSTDKNIFTATKESNTEVTITPVAVGSAELIAQADNGLKSQATVTVIKSTES